MLDTKESSLNPIVTPRRNFFRYLLSEAIGLVEEFRGKPQMRLSDLSQVPDELLRQMMPVLNETRSYSIEQDRVLLHHRNRETSQEVYHLNVNEHYMLRFFDGQHSLEDIGRHVANEFGTDTENAYLEVKILFLALAKFAICHPAQAHEEGRERGAL